MLAMLVEEGSMSSEHADGLVKCTMEEVKNGDIYTHSELLGACSLLFELSRFFRHVQCIYRSI
jgi:hypothetical protein